MPDRQPRLDHLFDELGAHDFRVFEISDVDARRRLVETYIAERSGGPGVERSKGETGPRVGREEALGEDLFDTLVMWHNRDAAATHGPGDDELLYRIKAESPATAFVDRDGHLIDLFIQGCSLPDDRLSSLILEFETLELLSIHDTNLRHLEFGLSSLPNLMALHLGYLPLDRLAPETFWSPSLVEVTGTLEQLRSPPAEIFGQGLPAILNYFESFTEDPSVDYLYEAKLVLVGRGFAGKTSLLKKLTIPGYELEDIQKSTEGIDIAEWDLDLPLAASGTFRLNIWDFGGQEKYDSTHQFFITERTLYLFVTEARQETNYLDFDYWLNVISVLGKGSPVVVVKNKIDVRNRELPTERYMSRFPNIVDFVDVSSSTGYGHTIAELVSAVRMGIQRLPQVGEELPAAWVAVRRELEAISADYIGYSDYLEICSRHGLDEGRADFLSEYFHILGIIVHHKADLLLRELVIVNPDWAVDAVYAVLDTDKIEEANGRFTLEDLDVVWGERRYDGKHAELLALMERYELCFPFGPVDTYIAPELLAANPPAAARYTEIRESAATEFVYKFDFMPAGMLTRLVVKTSQHVEGELFWKHGVVLRHRRSHAIVLEDETARSIEVRLTGPTEEARDLLGVVRYHVALVAKDFAGRVNFDELVVCICEACANEPAAAHFFKLDTLMKYDAARIKEIRCESSLQMVPIDRLSSHLGSMTNGMGWTG